MFPRIAAIKAMEAGDGGRGAAQLEAGQQERLYNIHVHYLPHPNITSQ